MPIFDSYFSILSLKGVIDLGPGIIGFNFILDKFFTTPPFILVLFAFELLYPSKILFTLSLLLLSELRVIKDEIGLWFFIFRVDKLLNGFFWKKYPFGFKSNNTSLLLFVFIFIFFLKLLSGLLLLILLLVSSIVFT